ncbi:MULTISPECIES: alpha/beta fold hydrolase [Streptomyces]|uniref:alpha/beta fold hydrolase n=1 Tax=Streptomyces TaxID=1883 RepID=UPI00287F40EB|nr:alpha/beta fold hydrolase [Streptomyces sp. CGMCC 4.1456]WNF67129.1 alpha/beta hydrolase [Streptomyces sp. CGMCC 4.1456]
MRDPEAERGSWLEALAVGARRAGHSFEGLALERNSFTDTAFAYYGDLFVRPHAQGGATSPDAATGEDEVLRRLLEEVIDIQLPACPGEEERRVLQHAHAELTATRRQAQGSGELVRRLVNVCTTLLALPGMRRGGQWASGRIMAGHLAQVTRYLARAELDDGRTLDERIRDRVLSFLNEDRPTVVIAHSLGSVVALEALHQHRGPIPLLVTVGSPIGMRTVVHPRLRPQPPATPDCVRRWLNYWDRDDIIAPRPWLERDVLPNTVGCMPVSDRVDSDGIWVHTATKYLSQASVAGPIVEAVRLAGESASA